jgi:hypothetical protein
MIEMGFVTESRTKPISIMKDARWAGKTPRQR